MNEHPHRRYNPLTNEWVLVSPHRAKRPWQGQVEKNPIAYYPPYDPSCYLCPGNERAGGVMNPEYKSTFSFTNDFAALLPEKPGELLGSPQPSSLLQAKAENGICRVICFSPRHDLTVPQLTLEEITAVITSWCDQTAELYANPDIKYVQVFENKGAAMGCSNSHPHCQIWSQSELPNEPAKELSTQRKYFDANGNHLLLDYLAEERLQKSRILVENEHFTALVPFWAVWPFEAMIISHRATPDLPSLTNAERISLAAIYQTVTTLYDNLFEISFPYSMGFHQAPNDGQDHPEWVLHAHFYPPLLRSATVKKFMVGYEMLGMPQRDITPETAAERLRACSTTHYMKKITE